MLTAYEILHKNNLELCKVITYDHYATVLL